MVYFIDIGGTPGKFLLKNKFEFVKGKQAVVILDPFDYSRVERTLCLTENTKIKFSYDEDFPTSLSAEEIPAPDPLQVLDLFKNVKEKVLGYFGNKYRIRANQIDEAYNQTAETISALAGKSTNLRGFMNGLVKILSPTAKIILLDDALAQNYEKILPLTKKYLIYARAICPECRNFTRIELRKGETCCGVSSEAVMKTGKYICEGGYFNVLTRICGYLPAEKTTRAEEYIETAEKVLDELKITPKIFVYTPFETKPMFEKFLLEKISEKNGNK